MTRLITLDTSVIFRYWQNQDQGKFAIVEQLLDLTHNGQLDLAITTRIHADVPRPELANRINQFPELRIRHIGSVFRLNHSALNGGDALGSDHFTDATASLDDKFEREGRKGKRPDWRDWDHLHGHYLAGRDSFLTWDGPILEVASELKTRLGIIVMTPEDFLASLPDRLSATP